jgi:monofunctional biosynthetic peptidoglycan transglycosylase
MARRASLVKRLSLLVAACLVVYAAFVVLGLPSRAEVRGLTRKTPEKTGLMKQREREAKAKGRAARRSQTIVPIKQISRWLIQAVIASEDQNFFGHQGVDWHALQESVEKNLEKGKLTRGGSTITQQLAKNLYFGTEKSATRKLRELLVTRWIEDDLTKRRILELYLNVIEWGDGIYGAEAAARRYFGKPASDLDVRDAAALAGMIPNPRRINPLVSPARVARAQKRVLWLMTTAGFLERTAAGLGSEPPPLEPLEEGDDPDPSVESTEPAQDAIPTPPVTVVPEPLPTPLPDPETTPTPPEGDSR